MEGVETLLSCYKTNCKNAEDWGSNPHSSTYMKYKIEKLDKPIFRSGRRIFKYKIVRSDGSTVFLFEDKVTAKQTLGKLN